MTRREARELAFILLFEKTFTEEPVSEILQRAGEARDVEGDAFALGKGAIIADNAVRGAVFTKMHIQIWNPFNSSRYIFLYLIPLAAFRQCGNLVEMMPHVVACLARILDGGFQVFIALPLHGKKVVFLL